MLFLGSAQGYAWSLIHSARWMVGMIDPAARGQRQTTMNPTSPDEPVPALRRLGAWPRGAVVALLVLLGVVIGVGSFTFGYGRGFSYFSPDPRACANCHIM